VQLFLAAEQLTKTPQMSFLPQLTPKSLQIAVKIQSGLNHINLIWFE
jgi:hypothetical protein